MSSIYLLGDGKKNAYYKVGITSDTEPELEGKYITRIPNVYIGTLQESKHARTIEQSILHKYKKNMVPNSNDNNTEWIFGISGYDLVEEICKLVEKYQSKK